MVRRAGRRPHTDVVFDWVLAVGALLGGTIVMVASLAVPSQALLIVIQVGGFLAAAFLLFQLIRNPGSEIPAERARLSARLPAVASIAAFIAYAVVLTAVHNHTVDRHLRAYGEAVSRLDAATKAAGQADAKAANSATSAVEDLTRTMKHLSPHQAFQYTIALTHAKQLTAQLQRGQVLAASKSIAAALPLSRAKRRSLLRELEAAVAAKARAARADALYIKALPGRAPALDAVPGWFGQLGRFFQLTVQLLAAMTIALIFTRRGRFERVSEQHLGVAMMFAFVGILAGLIGSLPELHRGLQAFLLGYVAAALAGVVTALAITLSAQGSPPAPAGSERSSVPSG